MESVKTLLARIDENQQRIGEHGKFDQAILKKINYKLRLDWNYYSNRMEGGTLTKAETRSVMVGNLDVSGKPFKDVAEMNGHDKIVLEVLKMSKSEIRISEKRIKELHKSIMHEDDAEKALQIGTWKTEPNEIINYKGEKISFTEPTQVAEEVHAVLNKTNAELDRFYNGNSKIHPVEIAAQFHIDFVSIHPFYDGNGRMSRILTNILLMSCDLPAIVVKDEHKQSYYKLLGDIQVYGGKVDLFYAFIAERVLETQQLIIDALEGKEIDEIDDIDKRLALLKIELGGVDSENEIKLHFNRNVFTDIFHGWLGSLIKTTVIEIQKFNSLFSGTSHNINLSNASRINFIDESAAEIIENLENQLQEKTHFEEVNSFVFISTNYGTLIKGGLKTFGCNYQVEVRFDQIKYEVFVDEFKKDSNQRNRIRLFENLLHRSLSENDIREISKFLAKSILNHIDYYTKKNGLR